MNDRTRTVVIGVVTGVWALNFVAGLIPSLGYESDQAINGIFMAIVGGLFALGGRKKDDGGNGGTPPPSTPSGGEQ